MGARRVPRHELAQSRPAPEQHVLTSSAGSRAVGKGEGGGGGSRRGHGGERMWRPRLRDRSRRRCTKHKVLLISRPLLLSGVVSSYAWGGGGGWGRVGLEAVNGDRSGLKPTHLRDLRQPGGGSNTSLLNGGRRIGCCFNRSAGKNRECRMMPWPAGVKDKVRRLRAGWRHVPTALRRA